MGKSSRRGPPPPASAKTIKYEGSVIPQLEDITETAGIHFTHSSALEPEHCGVDEWGRVVARTTIAMAGRISIFPSQGGSKQRWADPEQK